MSDAELLKFMEDNGMIELSYVKELKKMAERKIYLNKHPYKIGQGKDGYWRTYLPDKEKGRKMIKKNTKKEVEDIVVQYYREKEERTFKILFHEWEQQQEKYGISGNTIQKYNSDYKRFFEGTKFEQMNVKDITEEDITEFMVSQVKKKRLKEKAGKALWGYVNGTFKYSRKHKIIHENPCDYVEKRIFSKFYDKSKGSIQKRTLNKVEIVKLLDELKKSHIDKPSYIQSYAVELAIYTGMRVGELAGLKWENILNEEGIIRICQSEKYDRKTKEFYIDCTKNGEEREFPISKEIEAILLAVKKIEMEYGFIGEYVFQNKDGRVHARSISHCMRYKCKQAGIDEKGIHALRRTLNSKMRCSGVSVVIASSLLGHTEEVNENNYTYDISEMKYKKELIEKLSREIG